MLLFFIFAAPFRTYSSLRDELLRKSGRSFFMSGDALLTKKILKKGGQIHDKRGED
jgi:hypothetical protein